ncbi:MAG TPA: hypothetical protein VK509_13425 [Polyangiales bacterium]|nr:hypothetical protein [Polyangiales bacterium]
MRVVAITWAGFICALAGALLAVACKSAEPQSQPALPVNAGIDATAGSGPGPNAPAAGAPAGGAGQNASVPPANAIDAGDNAHAGSGSGPAQPTDAAVAPPADARVDALPDAGTMTPPQVCAPASLRAGDSMQMLEHGGRSRRYLVHVPGSVQPSVPVPLVLDFHGNGSSAAQEAGGSGWVEKADAEGFIAVHPDGVGRGWNVGNCCGEALTSMVDDVGFAKAIVTAVSGMACIDPKRI